MTIPFAPNTLVQRKRPRGDEKCIVGKVITSDATYTLVQWYTEYGVQRCLGRRLRIHTDVLRPYKMEAAREGDHA